MVRSYLRRSGLLVPVFLLAVLSLLSNDAVEATHSFNPLARAVKKTGKAMYRRIMKVGIDRTRHGHTDSEDVSIRVHVDAEQASGRKRGRGRRGRRRVIRKLEGKNSSTHEDQSLAYEQVGGIKNSSTKPEPMKISLDMHIKDIDAPAGDSAPVAINSELPPDTPPVVQHNTLIAGLAVAGGLVILAVAFTCFRRIYLRRSEEHTQERPAAAIGSPRKRPMELQNVSSTAAGDLSPAGQDRPGLLSGRLAEERAGEKGRIITREESSLGSARLPFTVRGDFFQLKEIDLGGTGVQSPGRGGPGTKVFSPRG